MKSLLPITVFISLLAHLLLLTPWLFETTTPLTEKPLNTIELMLAPQPQAQTKPADTPPPTRHLEDDITKANNQNGHKETPSKPAQKQPDPQRETEKQKAETSSPPRTKSNSPLLSDFLKQQKEKTSTEKMNTTNTQDAQTNEEEMARWYNAVLKRISEQVNHVWVKPQGLSHNISGIIRLNLNPQGYLTNARIHVSSGHLGLDRSAMRAVQQVPRYDIPRSPSQSRYYRQLEFRYNAGEP